MEPLDAKPDHGTEAGQGAVLNSVKREKRTASILYVEDEAITRMTVHRLLQARYSTIHLACDGREGLESFQRNRPDVVITDTRMPQMDGIRMSYAIREISPTVPIIFITANEDADFIAETRKLNVACNIIKPIVLRDLFAILENVLGSPETVPQGARETARVAPLCAE